MNAFDRGYADTMEKVAYAGLVAKGIGAYRAVDAGKRSVEEPGKSGFWEGAKAAAPFTGGYSLIGALISRNKFRKALEQLDAQMPGWNESLKIKTPSKGVALLAGLVLGSMSTALFGGVPGAIAASKRKEEMEAMKAASINITAKGNNEMLEKVAFILGYKEVMEKVADGRDIGAFFTGGIPGYIAKRKKEEVGEGAGKAFGRGALLGGGANALAVGIISLLNKKLGNKMGGDYWARAAGQTVGGAGLAGIGGLIGRLWAKDPAKAQALMAASQQKEGSLTLAEILEAIE
jgi:hypothetical protein